MELGCSEQSCKTTDVCCRPLTANILAVRLLMQSRAESCRDVDASSAPRAQPAILTAPSLQSGSVLHSNMPCRCRSSCSVARYMPYSHTMDYCTEQRNSKVSCFFAVVAFLVLRWGQKTYSLKLCYQPRARYISACYR